MEEAQNISTRLSNGIDALLNELGRLKIELRASQDELHNLREQVVLLKAENEAKNTEISGLYDELGAKEKELETLVGRIESAIAPSNSTSLFGENSSEASQNSNHSSNY